MAICKFKVGDKVVAKHGTPYVYTTNGWMGKVTGISVSGLLTVKDEGNPSANYTYSCLNPECFDLVEEKADKIVITHDGKTTTATLYRADGSKEQATAKCAPEDDFNFRVGAEIAMGRLVDKLAFANHNVIRVVFREGERPYSYTTRMQTAKVGMKIVVPVGEHGKKVNATVVEIIPGAKYDGAYAMSAMKEIDIVEVPEPPKYWTGRVVCIESNYGMGFTVGKIYKVANGKLIGDQQDIRPYTGDYVRSPEDFIAKNTYFNYWPYKFVPLVE